MMSDYQTGGWYVPGMDIKVEKQAMPAAVCLCGRITLRQLKANSDTAVLTGW